MAKYRVLTSDELEEMEQEFIEFLVVNGIVADDWEKMKSEDPVNASKMTKLFSDVVFESILRKSMFIDWIGKTDVRLFQCLDSEIILIGMKADDHSTIDFRDAKFLKESMTNPPNGIKIYTTKKEYNKEREVEMFDLLSAGGQLSEGALFKSLAMAL